MKYIKPQAVYIPYIYSNTLVTYYITSIRYKPEKSFTIENLVKLGDRYFRSHHPHSKIIKETDFGKLVFLDKADAEAVLQERNFYG